MRRSFPKPIATLALSALILAWSSAAGAAPIFSDSFENGPSLGGGSFLTLPDGSTALPGWTVGGSVDIVHDSLWQASDANHSLDLAGLTAGSLTTDLATLVGHQYTVSFDLAGNPAGGPVVKEIRVETLVGGAVVAFQDFSFDNTGTSLGNMGWTTEEFQFQATALDTQLRFTSLTAGGFGPALDNVQVVAMPEPGTALLFASGLVALAGARRRVRA